MTSSMWTPSCRSLLITKTGDVWTLGRHRLVCGDSTKPETFSLLMDGLKANLRVITDPPTMSTTRRRREDQERQHGERRLLWFSAGGIFRIPKTMADDASIYVFHADTEG